MAGRTATSSSSSLAKYVGGSLIPTNDYGHQPIDARKARLCDIVQETGAKTIHYLYDFGDSWDHVIKLEKWFDNTTTEGLPLLLEAAGRCPPEDVGGAPGYAEYLDAISDPAHPEHEHMRLWGPERFDPNVVDRKALEAAVNALSEKWKPRRRTKRIKIGVKRQSKGPQSYAYRRLGQVLSVFNPKRPK